MISLANASREMLERIFYYSTALDDLFEREVSTPYSNGIYLKRVEARNNKIKDNLSNRKAITNVCRVWHDLGLKYRCELLVVDAKGSETWEHVAQTFKQYKLGQHVRRLHFDGFDSSTTRVKSAVNILRQCANVKYISLTFADDSRKHSPIADLFLFAIRSASASGLEHLDCDFGHSFEQGALLHSMDNFPNMRTLQFQSAYGLAPIFDPQPLHMASLRKLKLGITRDKSLDYLSSCSLPSLEELSIVYLHSAVATGNRRFFRLHGSKIRSLELKHVVKGLASVLCYCVNLEELVLSLDGFTTETNEETSLFHQTVVRIGVRDISINSISVSKTMAILDTLMRKFTSSILFPRVQEVRLLDFHKSLLVNLAWERSHAGLWKRWEEQCNEMSIVLQGADGQSLRIGSIRIKSKDEGHWLSMPQLLL